MADRTVSVRLKAEIAGYMAGLRTAGIETKKFAKDVGSATGQHRKDYDQVGKGLLAVGAAALTGAAMAAKAAIDWESSFAGVEKTVDGTAAQMSTLEGQLRDMATSLPATHEEIAAVAEAAGQLGVKRDDIASFTKVMIDLGETTNLTADQAATAIAQISNVMGTSHDDVDRLGSALVALGNDGASTEAEILTMAQRIAGAGNQIGLAETDVLGFASALASVGIEAEAGGSSISTTMVKIAAAVAEGGDKLEEFAKVAGVSGGQFSQLFEQDSAEAITVFVEGLGRMQKSGEDVFGTLTNLGLSEIRTRDAMLRLAGAGDLLRESLDLGAESWRANNALTDEAQKRYDTAASKIQVAWNNVKDTLIDVGSAIAPTVGFIADAVGGIASAFDLLPGPVKEMLGVFGGLAGVLAIAGGGFLLFAPRIAETRKALQDLNLSSGRIGRGLSMVGKAAAGAAAGVVILELAGEGINRAFGEEVTANIDKYASSLAKFGREGSASGETARVLGGDLGNLDDAFWAMTGWDVGVRGFMQSTLGGMEDISTSVAGAEKRFGELDAALGQLAEGDRGLEAARAFDVLAKKAREADMPISDLLDLLPTYREELVRLANVAFDSDMGQWGNDQKFSWDAASMSAEELARKAQKALDAVGKASGVAAVEVGDATDEIALRFGVAGKDAEESAKNVQKMFDEWAEGFASFVPMVGAYEEALARKQEAEQKSAEKTAESAGSSGDSWKGLTDDVTLTVDEYLEQLERMTKDQDEWADNMIDLAGRVPDEMLNELATLGPEGAGMVALLNKMTDSELQTVIKNFEATGLAAGQKFSQQLAEAGPVLREIADSLGQGTADKIAEGMKKRGTSVYEEAKRQGVLIDRGVDVNRRRIVKFDADATLALAKAGYTKKEIERLLGAINDEGVKVKFTAAQIGGHPTQRGTTNADGNVYENHQAEIARGGAWRLWAEPETGGEAYIPLAQSKRGRSMAIFEQVAQKFGVGLMPFADGGTTVKMTGHSDFSNLPSIIQSLAQANVEKMIAAGMLSGPMNPGLAGALSFAMAQRGKPYGWGAVGPSAYDCSGFMSAIANVALGRNPYSRLGSTASFPWSMFTAGPGAFTIGSFRGNPGHMAGTLNGVNVESRGSDGVVVGPSARGANSGMFTTRAHLKGFADGGIEGDGPFDQLDPRGMYFGRGFRYGTDFVPWDGMYKLHRGEQVSQPAARSEGRDGYTRLHPSDVQAIAKALSVDVSMDGQKVARIIGKHSGKRADLISRGG